ncbi:MAG: glycoside hydrolase family 99-like domain-containing protein [Anaerolineales bacterium]
MKLLKPISLLLLSVLLLISCAQAAPEKTLVEDLPPTKTHIPTPDWSQVPSCRAHLTITTSSDWTTVRLREGIWHSLSVISASEQAEVGEVSQKEISLSQLVSRSEAGEQVELVVEAYFAELEVGDTLVFEIESGYAGSTQVVISNFDREIPSEITTLTWSGISSGSQNAQIYEVSADPFLGSAPNEYIVISQMNFWYFGPGPYGGFEDAEGNRTTPLNPLLGDYWSADPEVIEQQIEWAVEYGVDAFSIEWDSPNEDSLGYPMEKIMDEVFLVAPNIHKIRWVIFYDFNLRMFYFEDQGYDITQTPNFNQNIVQETFVNDFVHFATKYFEHPQYLTIDGRPIVYIWATHGFRGDVAPAVQVARQRVAELGYDVYIVGDEVCYGCYNSAKASLFDATSTFTFLIPGVDFAILKDVGDAARTTDIAFSWWRDQIADLKVAGREDTVNFQPGWAPQYDERGYITDNPIYVPANSKEQVIELAKVAREHAQPAGEENLKLIWVNTWNCWAETTTVEPTIDRGPKYPGGNYGFDMLDVILEVFGSETFYTSPVP